MNNIRKRVLDALNNSMINEYRLKNWTVDEIITDLLMYCADLEGFKQEEIKPFVIEWQQTIREASK